MGDVLPGDTLHPMSRGESPARRLTASATVATAAKTPNIMIVEREEIFPTDMGSGGRRASRRDRRPTVRAELPCPVERTLCGG